MSKFSLAATAKKALKENHPWDDISKDLKGYEEDLTVATEDLIDKYISFLVELDDSIGTSDPLYKRVEKLVDKIQIVQNALPSVFEEYSRKLESAGS